MIKPVETIETGREIEVDLVELVSASVIAEKLYASFNRTAEINKSQLTGKLTLLTEASEYLEQFPEETTTIQMSTYDITIHFYNEDTKTARQQRSATQLILNEIAKRELDYNGKVQWRFKKRLPSGHRIEVIIPNGTLAPNCRLESKVTRPRQTEWKIVCDDNSKSITTTRALKGK